MVAFAQTYTLTNPIGADDLIALLDAIIEGLILLAIPVTVIILIWAGVLYIISRGGEAIKKATKALTFAVLGFGLLLISSGIVAIIQDFLGVKPAPAGTPSLTVQGPTTFADVLKILTDLSGWLFAFTITGGVAMIIVSGGAYIFARGNQEQAGRALRILIYSVVGVALASLAWAIINIVANFLVGKPIFS